MQSLVIVLLAAQLTSALAPGRVHEVRPRGRGIQSEFPSRGAFERGLEHVRRGEFLEAGLAYQSARGEFLRMMELGRISVGKGRLWVACATMHYVEAAALERSRQQLARDAADLPARGAHAQLLHNQWLAREAYFGRRDPVIAAEVERAYHAALDDVQVDDDDLKQTRLAFAGFLASQGRRAEAERELKRAYDESDTATSNLAFAYAALGDHARALKVLARLRQDSNWTRLREHILVSNDFDALRDDPAFIRLVGTLE